MTTEQNKNESHGGRSGLTELLGWQPIQTAPMDGTKIVVWFAPNEVYAPEKAKPRVASWQLKQWMDGAGNATSEPFGMWSSDEGCGPMSYAPSHWIALPDAD
ncbi:MAG: hypothetical protein QX197_15935 [Methylococcaceae bacterium]